MSVADAGSDCGPGHGDARIRKRDKPYVGNGNFDCDGSSQTLNKVIGPGEKAVFDVRVRNDSGARADMKLTGPVPDYEGFEVRFVRPDKDNKDVADRFLEGDLVYKNIAAGKSTPALRIIVKAGPDVGVGDVAGVAVLGGLAAEDPDFYDRVDARAGVPTP